MKKNANAAIVYSFLALAGGVFYREFTKFNGFGGATSLGFVHPHYLMLGVFFFLALIVFDKLFNVSQRLGKLLVGYQVGLNLSVIMMLVRGVLQVLGTPLSSGANAAISGIAGIGHIIFRRQPGYDPVQDQIRRHAGGQVIGLLCIAPRDSLDSQLEYNSIASRSRRARILAGAPFCNQPLGRAMLARTAPVARRNNKNGARPCPKRARKAR